MRCPHNNPYEGRCRERATVAIPTGYGADTLLCEQHARRWGDDNRRWFDRLQAFYASIGQQRLREVA